MLNFGLHFAAQSCEHMLRTVPCRSEHLKKYSHPPSRKTIARRNLSSERRWSLGAEDLLGRSLGDTVRQGEAQVLGDQLLDVGALDLIGLLQLDNSQDLSKGLAIRMQMLRHMYRTYVNRPESCAVAGRHILV